MKKLFKSMLGVVALVVMMMAMSMVVSAAESTITVPERFKATDMPYVKNVQYTNKDVLESYRYGKVIPLKVSKPGVVVVSSTDCEIQKSGYAVVYTDAACTDSTEYYESFDVGDTSVEGYFVAGKAGTYYLKVYTFETGNGTFTNNIFIGLSLYTLGDKTITSGNVYAHAATSYEAAYYYKFKATKTGYLGIVSGDTYTSEVVLTNAKKKEITSSKWLTDTSSYAAIYPVQKGKTYYVKFTNMSKGKLNGFTVVQKAIKEKSGKKKAKAVAIKAKKTVKGTQQVGEKADWYKFSVKKKKAVTLTVKSESSNYLKVTVYTKGGTKIGSRTVFNGTNTYKLTYGTVGKVNKGTYYIKVERDSKKSSGYYTLKWK